MRTEPSMGLVSESWLGVEFYFIVGSLEWGTHEPPSFIVNQRQGGRKRRKHNKIELEFSLQEFPFTQAGLEGLEAILHC
jgi:hypothetical protein